MNYGFARVEAVKVVPSRWQARKDGYAGERFDGLVASIKEHGIINPPKAFLNEQGLYELVTGHRRLAAARKAGETEIPIDLMTDIRNLPDGTADEVMGKYHQMLIVDNLHHEDLTPIEEAQAIHVLVGTEDMTQEQAAKVLGKSQQWVSDRLSLLRLAPEVQDAITAQALDVSVAQKLSQLPEDVQPRVMEDVRSESSRQAGNIIKRVKEALEPGFWDLPADKAWDPEWINIKRAIDHLLRQARVATPDKMGEIVGALHGSGLLRPPNELAAWQLHGFARICGVEEFRLETWLKAQGHECASCVWRESTVHWECTQERREICNNYMAEDDPVRLRIPIDDEQCRACKEEHGSCTDVGCYIERKKAQKVEQEEELDEIALEEEIEAQQELREFYERQQGEDVDTGHWMAQACEHCELWNGPESKDPCGHERPSSLRFTFWQGPVIVPRCGGYRLRDLSRIPEVSAGALREIMISWITGFRYYGGGSALAWLCDDPGSKLAGFLKKAELSQKQLAALVTMVLNDRRGGPNEWDRKPVKLMDPVTGKYERWGLLEEQDQDQEEDLEENLEPEEPEDEDIELEGFDEDAE